jgi:hypothetical protein
MWCQNFRSDTEKSIPITPMNELSPIALGLNPMLFRDKDYFPIQNLEKILPNKSSVEISPVMLPK